MTTNLESMRRRQKSALPPQPPRAPEDAPRSSASDPSGRTIVACPVDALEHWTPAKGTVVVEAEVIFSRPPAAGTIIVVAPGLPTQGGLGRSGLRLIDFAFHSEQLDGAEDPTIQVRFGVLNADVRENPVRFGEGQSVFVSEAENDLGRAPTGTLLPTNQRHVDWTRAEYAFGLQVVRSPAQWIGTGRTLRGQLTFAPASSAEPSVKDGPATIKPRRRAFR